MDAIVKLILSSLLNFGISLAWREGVAIVETVSLVDVIIKHIFDNKSIDYEVMRYDISKKWGIDITIAEYQAILLGETDKSELKRIITQKLLNKNLSNLPKSAINLGIEMAVQANKINM